MKTSTLILMCIHCRSAYWPTFAAGECRHDAARLEDRDGLRVYRTTTDMRAPDAPCGPDAKLFKAKERQ